MIRITLVAIRSAFHPQGQVIQKEFHDDADALRWFVEDSYFQEPRYLTAVWERFDD